MKKWIITVASFFAFAVSGSTLAQNTSGQGAGDATRPAAGSTGTSANKAQQSGQNGASAARKEPATQDPDTTPPVNSGAGTDARATGAGPSVPREGDRAATSGDDYVLSEWPLPGNRSTE